MGMLAGSLLPQPQSPAGIEWLAEARAVPAFELASAQGRFTQEQFQGRWTFIVFGYMQCPDICPTSLASLAGLSGMLGAAPPQFVFVSVDPQRDSTTELAEYVAYFDPGFVGATGEADQLLELSRGLGIQFKLAAGESDYLVAHSIIISIIDPAGNLRARLRPGFDVAATAADFSSRLGTPAAAGRG